MKGENAFCCNFQKVSISGKFFVCKEQSLYELHNSLTLYFVEKNQRYLTVFLSLMVKILLDDS